MPLRPPPTLVVLTALPVEANAVLSLLEGDTTSQMVGNQLFEVGHVVFAAEQRWKVVVAELGPGNVTTAAVVPDAVREFSPDVLLFVGIAGALKDDVAIGDVVAADTIAWTERAKETDGGRLDRPNTVPGAQRLVSLARRVARRTEWYGGLPPDHEGLRSAPKAIVGQIASGEEVVASAARKDELRKSHSDALAIENEGFGFARIAQQVGAQGLVIRGICDNADSTKTDDAHEVAARAAAAFALEVVRQLDQILILAQASDVVETPAATVELEATEPLLTIDDLSTDVDLLSDDRKEVEAAASEFATGKPPPTILEAAIRCGQALTVQASPLVRRRLEWFGAHLMRLVASTGTLSHSAALDSFARDHAGGAALVLSDPLVWASISERTRRRVLTGLVGPPDGPRKVDAEGIRVLVPLMRAGALDTAERSRVDSALALSDYWALKADGLPVDLLVPRVIEDLETGNFDRQNPAIRFLATVESSEGIAANVDDQLNFALGEAIVDAAPEFYPAFGAVEALELNAVMLWPLARLAGGIFAGLTYSGGERLRTGMSLRVPTLVAAAVAQDELSTVLRFVTERLRASVRTERGLKEAALMLANDLSKLSYSLDDFDRAEVDAFQEFFLVLAAENS
jgi:nucleoside phosphorylase